MSGYKIVFSDYYYPNLDAELKEFEKLGEPVEIIDCTKIVPGGIFNPEELIPYVKDCDALVVQFSKITAQVIQSMEKCKIIARYAIGVDNIDLDAAREKGIMVANVPDYCIDEVANTAIAHIMNAMRKITVSRDMLLSGTFDMNAVGPMKRMKNAVLGLLGFGNIARDVAKKMKDFFAEIVVYDPYFQDVNSHPEVKFMTLEEVLKKADVLSVHVPLSPSTQDMLSYEQFAVIKEGAVVVNTARGGLICEDALIQALDSGRVSYAGLDVICTEDFENSKLLRHPKAALTPHVAWCSEEALAELQKKVGINVVSALIKGEPVYRVK